MSKPVLLSMRGRAIHHEDLPAPNPRPLIVRRMTPEDYQRHEELVLEARAKAAWPGPDKPRA